VLDLVDGNVSEYVIKPAEWGPSVWLRSFCMVSRGINQDTQVAVGDSSRSAGIEGVRRGNSDEFLPKMPLEGCALAAVISIGLVLRSARIGAMQALGWSLLAFVVFGPVVWPWYETWGFDFLAVIAEAWTLRLLLALSSIAGFADLPGVRFYKTTDPALAIVCWTLVVGLIIAYGVLRLVPSIPKSLSTHVTPSRFHAVSNRSPAE
jgi:hypothetical protein